MAPHLIFGTSTFGMDMTEFQDAESVRRVLAILKELGIDRLDTAARYPPFKPGRSEQLFGEANKLAANFLIDTKVYTDTGTDGSGDLSREAVEKSINSSFLRLRAPEGVNILYAHRPDPATPLKEQIQALCEQVSRGHCQAWGVSNFPPALLEDVLALCQKNGWQKPGYYQGAYSLITRGMESKILPILRAHNIPFVGYQLLAAGFLTGKLVNNEHADTRLSDSNPLGKVIQRAFGSEELRSAMKRFDSAVKAEGLTSVEVALRWVAHHSALGDGDAIILGASKTSQIQETVSMIRKGGLSPQLVGMAEEIWEAVKESRSNIL